uniref:Uncharacterized protein TCIL3000_4_1740 n=1 Tax=Trypanosoma congolense (strain IL3000) TaxID=1068625 RepID=G0UL31_TRYCI|nr:unnamed protein product [Trypanosoma congolense IL3000]
MQNTRHPKLHPIHPRREGERKTSSVCSSAMFHIYAGVQQEEPCGTAVVLTQQRKKKIIWREVRKEAVRQRRTHAVSRYAPNRTHRVARSYETHELLGTHLFIRNARRMITHNETQQNFCIYLNHQHNGRALRPFSTHHPHALLSLNPFVVLYLPILRSYSRIHLPSAASHVQFSPLPCGR